MTSSRRICDAQEIQGSCFGRRDYVHRDKASSSSRSFELKTSSGSNACGIFAFHVDRVDRMFGFHFAC